jgi:cell division protein FtsZ
LITESIDKDAKVIFGTIHDEKLKKGELKVTVIATSFPADMPRKSLFNMNQTLLKDESPQNIKKEIHNVLPIKNGNGNGNVTIVNDPAKKVEKKPEIEDIIIDDADDWSAVPAFLRRNKK